jgi:hypothetical protein
MPPKFSADCRLIRKPANPDEQELPTCPLAECQSRISNIRNPFTFHVCRLPLTVTLFNNRNTSLVCVADFKKE